MIIKGFRYIRNIGSSREWKIVGKDNEGNNDYAYFETVNLLIAKNSAGKSRTLDAIKNIAFLVSGRVAVNKLTYPTQYFDFLLEHDGKLYNYVLDIREHEVVEELLKEEDKLIFCRSKKESALEEVKSSFDHLSPTSLVSRIKHNGQFIFKNFVHWASILQDYQFADQIQKNNYVETIDDIDDFTEAVKTRGLIIPALYLGLKKHKNKFKTEVLNMFNMLQYDVTDLGIKKTGKGYSLYVEEEGSFTISQKEMSQGMYRALAATILLTYVQLEDASICILMDDVGEGLDHDRSKLFVGQLIYKTQNSKLQTFMSSNDRQVMNTINIRYWSIIDREKSKSIFYNTYNSAQAFEDFKFTGLNNYDFFSTNFYKEGFQEDHSEEEESCY